MAIFQFAVTRSDNFVGTVRVLRNHSDMTIAELRRRMGTSDPVVTFQTDEFVSEIDVIEGHRHQHARVLAFYKALTELDDSVVIFYKPSIADDAEEVSLEAAKNIMESELIYLDQERD